MDWKQRAKARMKELGLTQDDMVKPLGLTTRGGVGHYLSGRREPSLDQMKALANELKMGLEELLGDADQAAALEARERAARLATLPPPGVVYVKRVVGVHLSAGTGVIVHDWEEEDRTRSFDADWMAREGLTAEACRLFDVSGDSMFPTICDKDTLMVNLRSRDPIHMGIFVLIGDDGPRVKRLIQRSDRQWEIHSDNDAKHLYPTEPFTPGKVAVWGEVVWQARKLRRGLPS